MYSVMKVARFKTCGRDKDAHATAQSIYLFTRPNAERSTYRLERIFQNQFHSNRPHFTIQSQATIMSARARVFAAYRQCFRVRKAVFHRDELALRESRKSIREEFGKNRHAVPTSQEFEAMIQAVDDALSFLRHSVMQAELDPRTGNYGKKYSIVLLVFCQKISIFDELYNHLTLLNFFHCQWPRSRRSIWKGLIMRM